MPFKVSTSVWIVDGGPTMWRLEKENGRQTGHRAMDRHKPCLCTGTFLFLVLHSVATSVESRNEENRMTSNAMRSLFLLQGRINEETVK